MAGSPPSFNLCLVVACVVWTGGAAAQEAEAVEGTEITCRADGYEVLLTNDTDGEIAAGQVIEWTVRFVRKSGSLELEEALPAGESLFISGALGSDYLSAPQPCEAMAR